MLGNALRGALEKRENVHILSGTEVTGYEVAEGGIVRAVETNNEEVTRLDCDVVVLCNGPSAPYHLYKHLNTILPSIKNLSKI